MWLCIRQNNKTVYQVEIKSFYPHTAASDNSGKPVIGVHIIKNTEQTTDPESWKIFQNKFVILYKTNDLWFKLPPITWDNTEFEWGVWTNPY